MGFVLSNYSAMPSSRDLPCQALRSISAFDTACLVLCAGGKAVQGPVQPKVQQTKRAAHKFQKKPPRSSKGKHSVVGDNHTMTCLLMLAALISEVMHGSQTGCAPYLSSVAW